ncbi:U8 snoRNA-decapping enzyme-like [Patagioenas fasciata]|uniref:U8 snoRNA-decapping enzyme-like n=1 Tax=Patagioenas fasciata TaxID=372321 RepID=UPI003A995288
MWEPGEQPPPLSREAALALGTTGDRAAGPGWRHACHVLLYAPLPAGSPPPGYAVLMQLRFDGRFGFPGGLVEAGGESLEAGLQRELREELGPAAAALRIEPRHHRGAKAWPGGGAGSGMMMGGGCCVPPQVQGLVRVPLGGGLPIFLRHRFAGDAREQLLGTLPLLGIPPQNGDPQPGGGTPIEWRRGE